MSDSTALCAACSAVLDPGAAFCNACGAPVEAGPPSPAVESFADQIVRQDRQHRLQRASRWLLALSVLFVLFGTISGFVARSQASEAHEVLAGHADDETLVVEGETYTVRELEKKIDLEVYLVFGLNYFLAAVMLGLYVWARRAPYPAMVTALCTYLAVIALNGVLEPESLAQGLLLKIFFILAMVKGIKAALEERDHGPPAGSR